ncbi:hypothetical protein F5Y11DRAFT_365539 [Daldinia sp. FL1419]|nr:hypothetical protein F5Y11DRAFT_365539 [Daldinia sp. FL1419]
MGKPDESIIQATQCSDAAPPPYTEVIQEPYRETAVSSLANDPNISMDYEISPYRPFPLVVSAHYQWKIITPTFHIGDATDKRLFAVKVHTGFGGRGPGRPGLVLHNGPSDLYPMLAAAGDEPYANSYSLNSIITLPPLSGSSFDDNCTEIMRAATSHGTAVFRFSIEVGPGKGLWREDFEWRKSNGGGDKDLVDAPWKCGFKLFRLAPRSTKDPVPGDETPQKTTTGNQELVAVFAWNSNLHLMDPFKIEFRGEGGMGLLGERFALMTVITGLKLWGLKQQGRTSESRIASGEARSVPGASR